MTGDDIGQLAYLVLLLIALGGYFAVAGRHQIGQMLRHALLWVLIIVGIVAASGLWTTFRDEVMPRQAVIADQGIVELPRAPDGHFYLTADVNGVPLRFVVDTGATSVVLSQQDAERVGLAPDTLNYSGQASTANGIVRTASVRLERFDIDGIQDRNVRAWVNEGALEGSLLGMTYLERFDRVEITRDRMILTR